MLEFLFMIAMVIGVYGVSLFVFWQIGDKVGARSRLFAVGLANTVTGFILDGVVDWEEYIWFSFEQYLFVNVMHYVFLILGLSGIVILAIELTKSINELSGFVMRSNEKPVAPKSTPDTQVPSHPAPQGYTPTWKRLQTEEETSNQK